MRPLPLRDTFAALTPVFFSPCTKPLSDHTLNMLFKQPILCRDAEALQKLALKFVKRLRHEAALNNFVYSPSYPGETVES